jgi:hypothetical protein
MIETKWTQGSWLKSHTVQIVYEIDYSLHKSTNKTQTFP